jgi:DNA-binding NarL/FixJ family response regulator
VATTLLLVDDNEGFRAKARRTLTAGGFEVVGEAADGESALLAVAELAPELVLLDVGLPDMTGFEVADRLREDAEVLVVFISTREAADYGDLSQRVGARGFLSKADLSADALARLVSSR